MERNFMVVNDDECYSAKLEYSLGWLFLHCEVHKPTPETIRRMRRHIKEVKAEAAGFGYSQPLLSVTRNSRFAKLMGGKFLGQVTEGDEILEVWSWE